MSMALKFVPMINGRAWEFTHTNGWEYQIVTLNGSTTVTLHYRQPGEAGWTFGHSRETEGFGVKGVAEAMYEHVTAGKGAQDVD
jgi:hypothetical protein